MSESHPGTNGHDPVRRIPTVGATDAELQRAIDEAVTHEQKVALARRLYEMAMGGDMAAAEIVLRYTIGDPNDPSEPGQE